MPTPHGAFVWHELLTPDPAAAQAFYTQVLGWGTQPGEGPMPYTMWAANGVAIGGVMALTGEMEAARMPPVWTVYIGARDVDATTEQAKALGGKVLAGPHDIPNTGRFVTLADPQGAAFAAYTASQDMYGPVGPPKLGEFSWHELAADDHVSAFNFYQQLFGWERVAEHDIGALGKYVIFGLDGVPVGGMFTKTPRMPFPPNWLGYVRVDDARRATDAVTHFGGKVLNGPMEVPGGSWVAQCMDPQGAMFAVHAL
jgi:uncharacterized protein